MATLLSDEFQVGGKVTAVFDPGVAGAAQSDGAARVLPALADSVPMKAKFRQRHRHFTRLLLGEGDPDPLANDFGHFPKARRLGAQQSQKSRRGQGAVLATLLKADARQRTPSARLFGPALSLR